MFQHSSMTWQQVSTLEKILTLWCNKNSQIHISLILQQKSLWWFHTNTIPNSQDSTVNITIISTQIFTTSRLLKLANHQPVHQLSSTQNKSKTAMAIMSLILMVVSSATIHHFTPMKWLEIYMDIRISESSHLVLAKNNGQMLIQRVSILQRQFNWIKNL